MIDSFSTLSFEVKVTILITFIAAFISACSWPAIAAVYIFLTKKLHCKIVKDTDQKLLKKALDFYVDRIDHQERVPPGFMTFYTNEKYTVDSLSEMKPKAVKNERPTHAFICSMALGKIYGIMKIIYLPTIDSYLIAYYASQTSKYIKSNNIFASFEKLLIASITDCHHLYYEIGSNKLKAKARLFSHLAGKIGYTPECILDDYIQPEVSDFDSGDMDTYNGRLYTLTFGKTEKTHPMIAVSEIFKHVYADPFYNVDKDHYEDYVVFLDLIRDKIIDRWNATHPISNEYIRHLYISDSKISGKGVFTNRIIPKHENIVKLCGKIIKLSGSIPLKQKKIVKIYEDLGLEPNGIVNYINHSCHPNTWIKNGTHVTAKKEIDAGEEVTIDYAVLINNKRFKHGFKCNCNTAQCRKRISGLDYLNMAAVIQNYDHFSPYINQLIKRKIVRLSKIQKNNEQL